MTSPTSSWRTRSTREIYRNRWITVREDEVTGPAGDGIYGVVTVNNPAVFVVAVDDRERVCFVTMERYATGGVSLEVPAGSTDGQAPLTAARRELREETGLVAATWTQIGRMNALNGVANAPEFVFLARELYAAPNARRDADEGILSVEWLEFPEALARVADGTISDGETVAALAYAAIALGRIQ